MKPEIPLVSGDEQDALTGWRKYLHWRPGQRKLIKRFHRHRIRRWWKRKIHGGCDE